MDSQGTSPCCSRESRRASRVLLAIWLMAAATLVAACGRSSSPATAESTPTPVSESSAPAPVPDPVEVPLDRDLYFEHLTLADGLSEGRVWDITQDSRGFMWFTTLAGLNRYDGYEFEIHGEDIHDPNSPAGNSFWTVEEDQHGLLWVGSVRGGGLSRFDPATEQWTRFQHDPDDPHSLSSNNVYDVLEDSRGVLWIGTDEGGLNRFDGETEDGTGRFTRYMHDPDDPRSLGADFAITVYEDGSGALWVGTLGGGLNRLDQQTDTFTRYQHDPEDPGSLSFDLVLPVYEDRSGVLWAGTYGGGLNRFDREAGRFVRYMHDPDDPGSISGDTIVDIVEDHGGTLWIATFGGGLSRYVPESDSFISYHHDHLDPRSLGNDTLASLYVDRTGTLWIGSAGAGVSKLDPWQQGFALHRHNPLDARSLSNDDARAVFEDRQGNVWIGTWGGGLNRLDAKTGHFTHFRHDPEDPTSLSDDHVYTVEEDSEGVLWVGADSGGLNRFDPDTETFLRLEPDSANPHSLSEGLVFSLLEDSAGTLWIGTFSQGLDSLDRETLRAVDPETYDGGARFAHHRHDPEDAGSLGEGVVYIIHEDAAGGIWVGTAGGGLNLFDRETGTFTHYLHDPEDPDSPSSNTVFAIHEDKDGALWIGTDGGLNRRDPLTGKFTTYTTADGLAHDTVYGILADENGHLWMSTARGLSHFDPGARTFHTYTASDGLQGDVFNPRSLAETSAGEMLFGGPNGVTGFDPDGIHRDPYIPPVHVTGLRLADKALGVGGDSPLQASILETYELALTYEDRIVSFDFAALSYGSPESNRYRYVLEGFDDYWHEADSTSRSATYTNLDPGDYVFRVIGSNGSGIWNEEGASIAISVSPPWWETTWFRLGILALGAIVLVTGYRRRVTAYEARSRELESQVAERTREMEVAVDEAESANLAKSRFLASMSHELRTPLNAILGFSRLLARDPGTSPRQGEMLEVINRSGEHLLGMVDDVLSLSSIEAGRVELKPETFDAGQMLEDVGLPFRSRAEAKGLQCQVEVDAGIPSYLRGDAGKLRQVLINLLGNAVKYTEQGQVWLRARSRPLAGEPAMLLLQIEVEDSGPGIPQDMHDAVFEAFVRDEDDLSGKRGTGLGLTISRDLVRIMDGEITVESGPGRGSLFRVSVPMQVADGPEEAPDDSRASAVVGLQAGEPEWRVLVVDDNAENRLLLTQLLEQVGFSVQEANNGAAAVAAFRNWSPHFIWMDMRMPVMDGYEATRQIRALPGGEEVRIAAVTASVFEEQRDKILDSGCDDVVRKPFKESEIFEPMATLLDVEYVYDEPGEPPPRLPKAPLSSAMLAELPPELLRELSETTLALDRQAALTVADRIADEAPDTAAGVRALVDTYQMGRLRELLAESGLSDDH